MLGNGQLIAPQALPCKVILELMEAYQCKHLVDLWPGPSLAKHVVAMGGSYVGLCSTPEMHTQLHNALFNDLISAIVNPNIKFVIAVLDPTKGSIGSLSNAPCAAMTMMHLALP